MAQARRTRDFWAGSFILSWLSAVAMLAVREQGGTIFFPLPNDNYLKWVQGNGIDLKPRQGSIPNRFKAEVNPTFDPQKVVKTVTDVWRELGEHIWNNDLRNISSTNQKAIWDKQITNFWEIAWALTDNEAESDILDRRKNWRSYMPPPQDGVKCMVMEGWQELSGAEGPGKRKGDPSGPDAFWVKVRQSKRSGIKTDLREGEYLSAIAFIKRRFARHFGSFSATANSIQVKGWDLSNGVPSVSYMAVCKWLKQIIKKGNIDDLREFHEQVVELTGETRPDWGKHPEFENDIKCVKEAINDSDKDKDILKRFASLDGSVFFESSLENKNLFEDQEQAKKVIKQLKDIIKKTDIGHPTPFYAILMMDGDSLGVHMGKIENQKPISEALNQFTSTASDIVKQNDGFLIYAGGDDVLAMLPIETALECARQLREAYLKAFELKPVKSTLSGAIEYAHVKMPLTKVLKDAHRLLDNIAKDGRGRDAIACRVWKPGGKAVEWAMPWKIAINSDNKVIIEELKKNFLKDGKEASFSGKFFFKLRRHFDMLMDFNDDKMLNLLATDYLASGVNEQRKEGEKINMGKAREIIGPLLKQCTPVVRNTAETDKSKWKKLERNADAALLVRFLANKGVER